MTDRREATVIRSAAEARRLGRYALVGEIAEGGMGRIYLARQAGAAGFEKLMAVKVMHPELARQHPELAEMFMDEARIASHIGHPNVCGVFDYGETHGIRYIVMEYLAGQSVLEVIRTVESRPDLRAASTFFAKVATVVAQACEGLHAAHSAVDERGQPMNIVHRDISPENVFVTYAGAVKVMDFGIARADGRRHQTAAGTFKGKYAYASPEAFTAAPLDPRTDIWSTGIVLWEMLTGRACFQRPSDTATMAAILEEPIPAPSRLRPEIPRELDAVAMRALQREPRHRYRTAREMARDLNQFVVRMGVHVGTAELSDWLAEVFPAQMRRAVETDRAARQLDDALLRAPELSDGGTRRALVSKVVHRGHVVGSAHGPVEDGDPDEPTRMVSNPTADRPPTPAGRTPSTGGEAIWPEQEGAEGRAEEGAEQIYAPPAPKEQDSRRRMIAIGIKVGVAVCVLGGGMFLADLLTTGAPASPGTPAQAVTPAPTEAPPESRPRAAGQPAPPPHAPAVTATPRVAEHEPAAADPTPAPVEPEAPPALAGARAVNARHAHRASPAHSSPGRMSVARSSPGRMSVAHASSMRTTTSRSQGAVSVFAVGGWADIFEGSRRLGRTPARITLSAGRHTLTLRPPTGRPRRRVVRVPAGGSTSLRVEL